MRRMIEPQAAALAAERADEEALQQLSLLLDRMERSTRSHATEDGVAADIAFHSAVLAATGNQMIASLRYAISAALRASLSYTREDLLLASLPAHRRVLQAIRSRKPSAARRAMEALIDLADHDLQVQSETDALAAERR
jgi:DNA-binding FadR family transcriptional regulator